MIRKQLVGAWDLALAWLAEPSEHHLLALLSVALLCGWPLEAAVLGLAWSGILRIGEVLISQRCDLILPCDSAPGVGFGVLRIRSPKTRGRAACHQAAGIDPRLCISSPKQFAMAIFSRHAPKKILQSFRRS